MSDFSIAFIGAGNMASSIVGGLTASGHPAGMIRAADVSAESLERLTRVAPVSTGTDNATAADGADVIILAVKPQVMAEVCASIAPVVARDRALVLTIAAGVPIASYQRWLHTPAPVVRCMPNTPSLLGCGASGLFASPEVSGQQRERAQAIMDAVGNSVWVAHEEQLHAVTAVSGSGPAYFFLFMESMVDAGEQLGLDRATAAALVQQTCLGAARMALESGVPLDELRRRVTSLGGTTEQAIASFESQDLRKVVHSALVACSTRSRELSDELG
ncbi:MAG: pyrroline-5-carboxylate reductase [Chromatocurvus sp.]